MSSPADCYPVIIFLKGHYDAPSYGDYYDYTQANLVISEALNKPDHSAEKHIL